MNVGDPACGTVHGAIATPTVLVAALTSMAVAVSSLRLARAISQSAAYLPDEYLTGHPALSVWLVTEACADVVCCDGKGRVDSLAGGEIGRHPKVHDVAGVVA